MRLLILSLLTIFLSACSSTYINKPLVGSQFPSIKGESLEKEIINIPEDFKGKPTLLLIGYKQNTQFDIDRWFIALDMTETQVDAYEVPTIQGMFPRMFSTVIDNGMRAGIPKELWKGVVTVYKDGDLVQEYTGNTNPNNARVALLDSTGKVVYFYDRGFSVSALNALRATLNDLQTP